MSRIDDLNASTLRDLARRVRKLETASPLGDTSISQGALVVQSAEGLIVSGSAKITGTLEVTGTETVTGTTNLNGPVNIAGTTTHTGTTNLDGPVNIDGATDIDGTLRVDGVSTFNGNGTINGDLTLGAGGKVTAGNVTLDPGAGSTGGLKSAVTIKLDSPSVSTTSNLQVGSNLTVFGLTLLTGITNTSNAANVYVNPTSKQLYMVTSAARYKLDVKAMELPDALLAVPVKDWVDKGEVERGEATVRIPGVIAEEVVAAGGEQFVTRDVNGEIQGVAYDRLALARTSVLAVKLEAALKRIELLERALSGDAVLGAESFGR